jgi:hypothetical protein
MKLKMVIKSLLLLDILNNGFELDVAILSKWIPRSSRLPV